jgi:hypothetical protein
MFIYSFYFAYVFLVRLFIYLFDFLIFLDPASALNLEVGDSDDSCDPNE